DVHRWTPADKLAAPKRLQGTALSASRQVCWLSGQSPVASLLRGRYSPALPERPRRLRKIGETRERGEEAPRMLVKPLLAPILDNEALTRGLGDPEARILVEWLVDRAERLAEERESEERIQREVDRLCRRARALGRFVSLWCQDCDYSAATQLAATERLAC